MEASYHRHDISDKEWALLEPHLPGQRGQWGGIAQDNRRFINAEKRGGDFCLFYSKQAYRRYPVLQELIESIKKAALKFLAEAEADEGCQ